MTTLPPAATRLFPENSPEKQVYNLVERFAEYIPVQNDRYRLSYNLLKYFQGEGDHPEILVKSTKIKITGIEPLELARRLEAELQDLKH